MPRFWHGIRSAIWKTRLEREMEEEIDFHLFMRASEGHAPEKARARFGNPIHIQEQIRDMNTFRFLESVEQDVRYAWRGLSGAPGFTAVAILSLALGIGANSAIFTLTNGVMLRMLPVERPEELRLLTWHSGPRTVMKSFWGEFDSDGNRNTGDSFSYAVFQALRKDNPFFTDIFAFKRRSGVTAAIGGQAEKVSAEIVSANMYSTLGVSTRVGRALAVSDETRGAPRVAVISDAYWSRRFGRELRVLGSTIALNTEPFTVVGVNPPDFRGFDVSEGPEVYVPLSAAPVVQPQAPDPKTGAVRNILENPDYWWVRAMGRIKPGASEQRSIAALNLTLDHAVRASLPNKKDVDIPKLDYAPGGHMLNRGQFELFVYILSAMAALVLAIACANLANLLLARSAARQRELAVRLALGAGRWRLVRQILTESMMLAGAGGAIGIAIGYWAKNVIPKMMDEEWNPSGVEFPFDYRVLLFTTALSAFTVILFGLIPALRATSQDTNPTLKSGGRGASRSRSHSRLGKVMVVTQIALSILLLVTAGLFGRTLINLRSVSVGFNPEGLLLFAVDPPQTRYGGRARAEFFQHVLDRVRAIPGVRAATASEEPLISNSASTTNFSPTGVTKKGGSYEASLNNVGPDFFSTLGIPMLLGRSIDSRDSPDSPKVAVINQTLARKYFGQGSPIGKTFNDGIQIVGVCADAHYTKLRDDAPPTFYRPLSQSNDLDGVTFELRTAGDPYRMVGAVRGAMASVDKDVPAFEIRTQTQQIAANVSKERLLATLTSTFSVLALVLACIGIFGVMAYTVARRTNEIGIRMALGAAPREVLRMVIGETAWIAMVGVSMGLIAATAATRALQSVLFGLTPYDPATLALASMLMMGVALTAGFFPARRASRVDPNVALRDE